jgi:hypothetical protein
VMTGANFGGTMEVVALEARVRSRQSIPFAR